MTLMPSLFVKRENKSSNFITLFIFAGSNAKQTILSNFVNENEYISDFVDISEYIHRTCTFAQYHRLAWLQ